MGYIQWYNSRYESSRCNPWPINGEDTPRYRFSSFSPKRQEHELAFRRILEASIYSQIILEAALIAVSCIHLARGNSNEQSINYLYPGFWALYIGVIIDSAIAILLNAVVAFRNRRPTKGLASIFIPISFIIMFFVFGLLSIRYTILVAASGNVSSQISNLLFCWCSAFHFGCYGVWGAVEYFRIRQGKYNNGDSGFLQPYAPLDGPPAYGVQPTPYTHPSPFVQQTPYTQYDGAVNKEPANYSHYEPPSGPPAAELQASYPHGYQV